MKRDERSLYPRLIFLLSFAFLLYEIAVLREIRFQISISYSWIMPIYFSSVLCLIGLGSILVGYLRYEIRVTVRTIVFCLAICCYPSFILLNLFTRLPAADPAQAFSAVFRQTDIGIHLLGSFSRAILLGYGCIFLLHGATYALLFSRGREGGFLSGLYASDLVAAGLGSIAAGVLSFFLTPADLVIAASFVFLMAFLLSYKYLEYSRLTVPFAILAFMAFAALEFGAHLSGLVESPAWVRAGNRASWWSPYQKVDVTEYETDLGVFVDGCLYYSIPKPQHPFLNSDYLFLWLARQKLDAGKAKILIVGSGLGRDVYILSRWAESEKKPLGGMSLTALELDNKVIESAKKFPWLWEKYSRAAIVAGEGRYFLENTDEAFDLIHYAYLDQMAAISSFAFPDAGFLYTDGALRRVYERLSPSGLFLLKRAVPEGLEDAVIKTLCATLRLAGISRDHTLLWISKALLSVPGIKFSTLYALIGKQPFAGEEKESLLKIGSQSGLVEHPWSEIKAKPATDLYPFSIRMERSLPALLAAFWKRHPAISIVLSLVILVLGGRLATSVSMAHFFGIGLAFMLIESIVLLNSFLLIGNPSLSAGVSLGIFLSGVGVGSLISEKLERRNWILFLLPLLVAVYSLIVPWFIGHSMAVPKLWRLLGYGLLIAPLAVMMGTVFPISLRTFMEEKVTRLFFINMVGCGLSPIVFQVFFPTVGYYFIALSASLLYLLAATTIFLIKRMK